jgi:hypothetical protein
VGQAKIFPPGKNKRAEQAETNPREEDPMKRLKTFLHRDFFEGDDTNKDAMKQGFVIGAMCILVVFGLSFL